MDSQDASSAIILAELGAVTTHKADFLQFFFIQRLSLPKILSTAENPGFPPDSGDRDVAMRVPPVTAGCGLQLRRREFLEGTWANWGARISHGYRKHYTEGTA
jgi:hypothetical protein